MSIIRAPYQPKRYKGALDKLVAHHLLDKYFESGQRILDPMAGSRTVELEAEKLGIICESNDLIFEDGWDVMQAGGWPYEGPEFHGIVMHPPYYLAKKYLKEAKFKVETLSSDASQVYTVDDSRDLGNIKDYWEFIMCLKHLMSEAKRVVLPGGYIILIIGDYRKGDRMRLVHADIYYLSTMELGLPLENYDLWEVSATGTPFLSTKHMMMLNWCLAFKRSQATLEEFVE